MVNEGKNGSMQWVLWLFELEVGRYSSKVKKKKLVIFEPFKRFSHFIASIFFQVAISKVDFFPFIFRKYFRFGLTEPKQPNKPIFFILFWRRKPVSIVQSVN